VNTTEKFTEELKAINAKIKEYISSQSCMSKFKPEDIRDGVYLYLLRSAKSLRPGILSFSCGAVGGNPDSVLPAAAAVEVFHNWTLVHDDIIDNDSLRRGGDTVHVHFQKLAQGRGYSKADAEEYGRNLAILVGDIQHSFAISLFTKLYSEHEFEPALIIKLIDMMELEMNIELVEGETIDVQLSKKPILDITEDDIISMSAGKTGALYSFSAKAGAMLGLETIDENNPQIKSLSKFAYNCGVAFQLQDDILGITGSEEKIGKPYGSDIKEGKRTTIVWFAYNNATAAQKKTILGNLGKRSLERSEIDKMVRLLTDLGGIKHTFELAKKHIDLALLELNNIADSIYKDLLKSWADFMIKRSF